MPNPPRSPRAGAIAVLLAAGALVAADPVQAQQRDSLRAGVAAPPPPPIPDTLLVRPPVSPRRAFVSSILLPGLGQARLERPTASALFFAIEAAGLVMVRKSLHDLRVAKRFAADSVPVEIGIDPETGDPVIEYGPGRYSPALVAARRTHLEDWIAVIIFNHIFAGADAFVAAHLAEQPRGLALSRGPDGSARLAAYLRW